jgi:hypothetical protein
MFLGWAVEGPIRGTLEMPFEIREIGRPELLVAGDPLRNIGERRRCQLVDPLSSVDSAATLFPDQPRVAQYSQVPRHRGTAYPEAGSDLARGYRAAPQTIKNRPSRWIGDGVEWICSGGGMRHMRICNDMVTQYPAPWRRLVRIWHVGQRQTDHNQGG